MKRLLTLTLIGLILLGGLFMAATFLNRGVPADTAAVDAANQLFASSHFVEAAQIYEQQIGRGVEDASIYFNLGNAYFQQGDLGRAVLNYQRAAQLDPRDADIQANLELARAQTTELFAAEPSGPLAILADLTGWLTLNETAVVVLAFWFLLSFVILARRQLHTGKSDKWLGYVAVIVVALLLISGLSLGSRTILEQTQPEGVVIAPSVAVSSGPGLDLATGMSLLSGTEINVVETQGEWVRVKSPGSTQNWLPVNAVQTIGADFNQHQDL